MGGGALGGAGGFFGGPPFIGGPIGGGGRGASWEDIVSLDHLKKSKCE